MVAKGKPLPLGLQSLFRTAVQNERETLWREPVSFEKIG
jgi:hypothetical protein